MQFKQYAWFTGRAAGYTDAEVATGKTHLSAESYQREGNKKITRGQAVVLSMDTLYDPVANGTQTLADKLVSKNVFTREKWEMIQADYETATDRTLTREKDILKNITELDQPYIIGSYAGAILLQTHDPITDIHTLYTWRRDSGLKQLDFKRVYPNSETSKVYDVSGTYCTGGYGLLYFKADGTVTQMVENGATQVYRLAGKIYATDYVEAVPSSEDETKPSGYRSYLKTQSCTKM